MQLKSVVLLMLLKLSLALLSLPSMTPTPAVALPTSDGQRSNGGGHDESSRIANGTLATSGQFPYYVAVTVNEQHKCGGFLYNDRWVVTAASCITDPPGLQPINVTVTVGALSLVVPDPVEQFIPAFLLNPHESYNTVTKFNDIALIQLSRPVVLDGTSAWFLRYDDVSDTDDKAVIMGWGATQDGGLPSASRLRWTNQTVIRGSKCADYTSQQFNSNYMICAGDHGPDGGGGGGVIDNSSPCVYDEGSPLVQYGSAVGIMSNNKGCSAASAGADGADGILRPTVYTRMTAYYSWLRTNAGQQPATTLNPPPG